MYYDEKKQRYIIAGEEESDDDEPPPPPPGAKKIGTVTETKPDEKKEEATGASSLTAVGFAGALSNRGRGRGAARGGRGGKTNMPSSRFPQTFDGSAITQTEKPY